MNEAGASLVGDMVAGEQRDRKVITAKCLEWMIASDKQNPGTVAESDITQLIEADACLAADLVRQLNGK